MDKSNEMGFEEDDDEFDIDDIEDALDSDEAF